MEKMHGSGLYHNPTREDDLIALENIKIILDLHRQEYIIKKTKLVVRSWKDQDLPGYALLHRINFKDAEGDGLFVKEVLFGDKNFIRNIVHDSYCGCPGCWEIRKYPPKY